MFVSSLVCFGKITPPFIYICPFNTTVFYFPFIRAVVQFLNGYLQVTHAFQVAVRHFIGKQPMKCRHIAMTYKLFFLQCKIQPCQIGASVLCRDS